MHVGSVCSLTISPFVPDAGNLQEESNLHTVRYNGRHWTLYWTAGARLVGVSCPSFANSGERTACPKIDKRVPWFLVN